ncbi:alpha/beta fold hydrolase [Cryomorphaceae bacterium]|nr:alpha/beta fold hydrolase [Cryomorphaceae bacterium]
MSTRVVSIQAHDHQLVATVFGAEEPKAILVIASATGVLQGFYAKFAQYMQHSGVTTITFDYQGIGKSRDRKMSAFSNNAADWSRQDLASVVGYAIEHNPGVPIALMGHSIGGQMISLTKQPDQVKRIIFVAAQSGYWKHWSGKGRRQMWFNFKVLIPGLSNLFGYLPSKNVTGMENLPKRMAKQWTRWCNSPDYFLSEFPREETNFDHFKGQVSAYSIENDRFAPPAAVEWLYANYSKAEVKYRHLVPAEFGVKDIGHFKIFKDQFQNSIWELLRSDVLDE